MLEDAAYRRLLDRIYSSEEGIPTDQAYRVVRARTKDEQSAVDAVLAEFFTIEDGRYVQSRAMAEIEKARRKIEASRNNGRTGGRPKKNPPGSSQESQQKPDRFSVGSDSETQPKALQTPDSKHQSPEEGSLRSPSGAREEESPEPGGSETHRTRDVPRGTSGFDGWAFVDQRLRPVYPRGTFQHPRWIEAARTVERLVESGADPELIAANAAAYCKQAEALGRAGTQWVKAPNRWLESGDWQGPFDIPPSKAEQQVADVIDAGQAWLRSSGASA